MAVKQKDYTITNFKTGDKAVILDIGVFDSDLKKRRLKEDSNWLLPGWYWENKYGIVTEVTPFNYADGASGTCVMIKCPDGLELGAILPEKIRKPNPLELMTKKFEN